MGDALYSTLESGLAQEAPVSVRLNPFKIHDTLDGCDQVPWCELGYWLTDRPAFTFDPCSTLAYITFKKPHRCLSPRP